MIVQPIVQPIVRPPVIGFGGGGSNMTVYAGSYFEYTTA